MSKCFLVSQTEFCDMIDRVQEQKDTVTIPVRWIPILVSFDEDDEEDMPVDYDLEDGEIYESNTTKNSLAAFYFLEKFESNYM